MGARSCISQQISTGHRRKMTSHANDEPKHLPRCLYPAKAYIEFCSTARPTLPSAVIDTSFCVGRVQARRSYEGSKVLSAAGSALCPRSCRFCGMIQPSSRRPKQSPMQGGGEVVGKNVASLPREPLQTFDSIFACSKFVQFPASHDVFEFQSTHLVWIKRRCGIVPRIGRVRGIRAAASRFAPRLRPYAKERCCSEIQNDNLLSCADRQ